MFRKLLLAATITGAALFGPMAFYSAGDYWKTVRSKLPSFGGDAAGNANGTDIIPQLPTAAIPTAIPVEGSPQSLNEVLRFDVTPGWVMARWPRVSTGMAELQLHGYRVPLVTGTSPLDMAGSLTYYFNPQQQVERISFHGTTGDVRVLVAVATTRCGMVRRMANDPGIVLYESAGSDRKVKSSLMIQPAKIVKASDPYRRFDVDLVMARPES